MSQYLSEAFKRLDTLNEETFSVTDNGLKDFIKFEEEDEFEDVVDVIDPEADKEEDLEDSYIGKVILDCCVCHSKIYKNVEDVVVDGDIANADEECPFCYTTDGYKVIGQVASFGEEEKKDDEDETAEEESPKDESLKENIKRRNRKSLKEGLYKDTTGIMGTPNETYSKEDLRNYWDNNKDTDPSLSEYKNFNDWFKDTISYMKELDSSNSLKEGVDSNIYGAVGRHYNYNLPSNTAEVITDLVERAIDNKDSISDTGEAVMQAIDEGLIYNKDIWAIKKYYENAELSEGTYEELFNDVYSIVEALSEEDLDESKKNRVNRRRFKKADKELDEFLPGLPNLPAPSLNASLNNDEELDEFLDANVSLDARGFGGKANNVSVLGGKSPLTNEAKSRRKRRRDSRKIAEGVRQKSLKESYVEVDTIECGEETYRVVGGGFDFSKEKLVPVEDKDGNRTRLYFSDVVEFYIWYDKNGNVVHEPSELEESKSIKESVNNVNVETDEGIINVATDNNGGVTVSTAPLTPLDKGKEEVITSLEPEVQSEISDNVGDGEEIEIDVDEFDEESFDDLGEGYLKRVYENVNSFKTTNVSFLKDKLILEGVIKFNSGKSKKTNFIFGIREATKSGKVRFIGENKEIARGKKSFTVTGRIENKKFLSESFNYNYGARNANGKAQRLYGTIKNTNRGK